MTTQTTKYLSCAETAKVVRRILAKKFPGFKFSVISKTYSGGASIDVHWVLGPTTKEVDKAVKWIEGAGFDGMIDLKFHYQHWMKPDGTIGVLSSEGTTGSMGVYDPIANKLPEGAQPVSFAADYIMTSRSYTKDWREETTLRERIAQDMCKLQGVAWVGPNTINLFGDGDIEQVTQHVWRLLAQTSFKPDETYQGVRYATKEEREQQDWDMRQVFIVLKSTSQLIEKGGNIYGSKE